ncbi:DUF6804 family protein [Longitalea arenae]|uniref:DUF6804 family protein n=1 Tax=Longitalea arenae TaxID=2812558 RepID=UPI0034E1F343
MKGNKFSIIIQSSIKRVVLIALIGAATIRQEDSCYSLLRWLVMTTFIYFGCNSYEQMQTGLFISSIAAAIIYNPIEKISFRRQTWCLDYVAFFQPS